jgi:Flp pilus assembly pilin Flp
MNLKEAFSGASAALSSFISQLANPFTLAIIGAVAFIATLAGVQSALKKMHE